MNEVFSIVTQTDLPMQAMGLWADFVALLYNILNWMYGLVGNFGIAVILFTIMVRLVLMPLDLRSKASMQKMSLYTPEIQKISEKYKNDPEKKNRKLQEFYAQHKLNPLGGCLPVLIQFPLFIAFLAALRSISNQYMINFYVELINHIAGSTVITIQHSGDMMKFFRDFGPVMQNLLKNVNAEKFVNAFLQYLGPNVIVPDKEALFNAIRNITVADTYAFMKERSYFNAYQFLWIRNIWVADAPIIDILGRSIPLQNVVYGISTGQNNGFFLLAAITGLTSYYQMKISGQQNAAAQQNKSMQLLFPLLGVTFVAMYTASFGIYWATSNVVMIIQQLIYNKVKTGTWTGKKPAAEVVR